MKKIPEVFVNKINKINNNKEVFYSYKDKTLKPEKINVREKINKLFKSNDFVYKKKFYIKTKYEEKEYIIISKTTDYLLDINGSRIYIDNILDING